MAKGVYFGIDLGTTNSCISMLKSNSSVPSVIPLKDGLTIPSCVMLNADGSFTVGKEAYEHRYEESTIYSVKRYMGSNKKIVLKAGEREVTLTPEEVSAEILKAIVSQASEVVGEGVIKDVTITVPAHFNDAQRRATKSAGELAGLNVVGIINEPTSAGLLYGLDNAKSNQTILVYDLGGGTFDVSILSVTKELKAFPVLNINCLGEYNKTSINIIGNDGDVALGGDDIDANVTSFVIDKIAQEAGISRNAVLEKITTRGYEELKLRLEKSKKEGLGVLIYNLPDYGEYTIMLNTKEVEEVCYRPLFNRTYDLISRAMATTGATQIDKIVLVGGSTKSKIIQSMLKDKFPHISIMNTFEPDLSVALGASISTSSTLGDSSIVAITDVVPMSIGLIISDKYGNPLYKKMLKKDTSLPCVYGERFDLIDVTRDIIFDIRQGESTNNLSKLVSIGKCVIKSDKYVGNKAYVCFKCDLNGVLSVYAVVDDKEIQIPIEYSANIKSASKQSDGVYETLDKGTKFFYDQHLTKLQKAGATEDVLSEWTPSVMLAGIPSAKAKFKSLLEKVK